MISGDGEVPREGREYALKVRDQSSSQGPVRVGLGVGLGQGQCDLPPLTMLAGTWNSNVCPGLAVSGTVSATWSWLGCALEEEFGQGLCRARVVQRHLLPDRRDPHELLPRYPCLRDVCLHLHHLLSRHSWRWHLARRRGAAAVTRGGTEKSGRSPLSARSHNSPLQVYMGEIPGTKLRTHSPHSDGPRTTVPRTMAHMGHGAWAHRERHGPPRSRRPARPDTHWTHTTHIVQLTKLEPGPTRNRVLARAY